MLLSVLLIAFPAQVEPVALEWTSVDKPGQDGNIVVSPSEVSEIAIGSNGVLYIVDIEGIPLDRCRGNLGRYIHFSG